MNTLSNGMEPITPRERILKRVRDALTAAPVVTAKSVDLESNIYQPFNDSLDLEFAQKFVEGGAGEFYYCSTVREAVELLHDMAQAYAWPGRIFCKDPVAEDMLDLAGVPYANKPLDAVLKNVVVCNCRYLIARDGSVLWDSTTMGRRAVAQADELVFMASVEQIMPDMRTAVRSMKERKERYPSLISRLCGKPNFTDIDGERFDALGPKTVRVILVDND